MKPFIATIFCIVFFGGQASGQAPVDYLRQIKPLLRNECYRCHGNDEQENGLRLDTIGAVLRGGKRGPAIVPGQSQNSLLIKAIRGTDGFKRMPNGRDPLSNDQISILVRWIDEGAKAPKDEDLAERLLIKEQHWSFRKPVRPALPENKNTTWPQNEIDAFVLSRLEAKGVSPSPEADRLTLIRRVNLDLIGLPPSPEEIADFVSDTRPDSYSRLVNRLLASPHYGERWGRHWLDGARYADSNGYSIDGPRSIWPYRDWVITALNRDMPFDQFAIEQIAGDMLPNATQAQKVATGFHRNTPINQEGGIDKEQFRVESVVDRVNTTSKVFLGLTLNCARCHDHKFDPFVQREYYEIYAFFNNSDEPTMEVGDPAEFAERDALRAQIRALESERNQYEEKLQEKQADWEANLPENIRQSLSGELKAALAVVTERRDAKQKKVVWDAFRTQDAGHTERMNTLAEIKKKDRGFPTTMVIRERASARESFVQIKGEFTRRGEAVEPKVPIALHSLPQASGAPNRLDFAKWLMDSENPLTARVTINRMWLHYFGKGLVETENDFGTQGTEPTHPQLLDWLAIEFIDRGWSMKAMHRMMVTSATYRQSSKVRSDLETLDPTNKLLARQSRLRLDAEIVRDTALAASGQLCQNIGGPSVFPPQPEGVMSLGQVNRPWTVSPGQDRYRRGIYTHFWRATPHPNLMVFDSADGVSTCTRRTRSNTPLQALTLLNDEGFFNLARSLAVRLLENGFSDDAERIRFAFELCMGRSPNQGEQHRLISLIDQQRKEFAKSAKDATAIVALAPAGEKIKPAELAAWTIVSRVLMNLDEFITRE